MDGHPLFSVATYWLTLRTEIICPVSQPTKETERLTLRPFRFGDALRVQSLAGERDIADTTMQFPHPYEDGTAEEWIGGQKSAFDDGKAITFAIELRSDGSLVGAIGFRIDRRFNKAELGYRALKPFWNCGYATEAAIALLSFGYHELQLNRIHAAYLARNPASGRVMEKSGMLLEGTARQEIMKWGKHEDLVSSQNLILLWYLVTKLLLNEA